MDKLVVVITGASSGIGLRTAKHLHALGYAVIGISRSLPKDAVPFPYFTADVANEAEITAVAQKIAAQEPVVHALINCAGMGISGAVEYATLAEVTRIFEVNVFGTFLATKAFLPSLRLAKQPKIINISSVAGELVVPFQTFYSMTKAAINAYTEGLRMELRPFGIAVSAVLPGDTQTGFTAARQKSPIAVDAIYKDRIKRSVERMEKDERHGKDPLTVAKACAKAVASKRNRKSSLRLGSNIACSFF
ncbi:MAG: SDR family NAD(P)-dependent oxidoreductase [Bacillus subtilis]|nr:SDR family NAD(P)-dependent oxidoreductase [Bacillus subtilis]